MTAVQNRRHTHHNNINKKGRQAHNLGLSAQAVVRQGIKTTIDIVSPISRASPVVVFSVEVLASAKVPQIVPQPVISFSFIHFLVFYANIWDRNSSGFYFLRIWCIKWPSFCCFLIQPEHSTNKLFHRKNQRLWNKWCSATNPGLVEHITRPVFAPRAGNWVHWTHGSCVDPTGRGVHLLLQCCHCLGAVIKTPDTLGYVLGVYLQTVALCCTLPTSCHSIPAS